MVSMLTSSAVDRGFELRSGQAKDYKTLNYCYCLDLAGFLCGYDICFVGMCFWNDLTLLENKSERFFKGFRAKYFFDQE